MEEVVIVAKNVDLNFLVPCLCSESLRRWGFLDVQRLLEIPAEQKGSELGGCRD